MPKLVKLDSHSNDEWTVVSKEDALPESLDNCLLPLDQYLSNGKGVSNCGVWLASSEDVYALQEVINEIPVIACQFDAFADGRSFSQARILREHLEYKGHIRAIGNFIQDQFHYLLRCGFDEFSVEDSADIASLQESMKDFSDSYQAACDVSEPLFRRRA